MLNKNTYLYYLKRGCQFLLDIIPDLKNFGIKIAILNFLHRFCYIPVIENLKVISIIKDKQHEAVYNFLIDKYSKIIETYENKEIEIGNSNKIIWCFWWQGIENAPQIIKNCINSVEKYSGEYEVIILDKNNYIDYVEIPDDIIKKLNNGQLTITHFSDILRAKLLSVYGGIWIDSSILICDNNVFKKFDNITFNTAVITEDKSPVFTKGRWVIGLMGGKPNKLFSFTYDLLYQYNLEYDKYIDYLLMDYIIEIAYDNFKECKEYVDNANLENPQLFYYMDHLYEPFNNHQFNEFSNKYKFFKLDYKTQKNIYKNGKITNIGFFSKMKQ